MRKSTLVISSIFCFFVLLSISYQPIVAKESLEHFEKVKISRDYINKIKKLTDLYNHNILCKFNSDEGCRCLYFDDRMPILICLILFFFYPIIVLIIEFLNIITLGLLYDFIGNIGQILVSIWLSVWQFFNCTM